MLIYQILVRLFGNNRDKQVINGRIEENGCGKLAYINEKALKSLKKIGITHIWLTGVFDHATTTNYPNIPADSPEIVKGLAGSPYAIRDYYSICPDLALVPEKSLQEFKDTIKRIHKKELKVLIDFVPNHLARDYHSRNKPKEIKDFGKNDDTSSFFSPNNNFYYLDEPFKSPYEPNIQNGRPKYIEKPAKATGNNVFTSQPHIHDWFEAVKLNYGINPKTGEKYFSPIPDTWLKMKDILLFWAAQGVDGYRCDMAEMVPIEFWSWLISKVKNEYPDLIFIAEIYKPELYKMFINSGFDYLYDKQHFYDGIRNILQGYANCDSIPNIWQSLEGINKYMLRFLENHDEQRLTSEAYCNDDGRKSFPAFCLSLTFNHMASMLYFGQEFGETALGKSGFSQNDGRTTIFDYWFVPSHIRWFNKGACDGGQLLKKEKKLWNNYKKLLFCYKKYKALQTGQFFDLHYFNRNKYFTGYSNLVYAYLKYTKKEQLLIVLNFSNLPSSALIKIPKSAFIHMGLDNQKNYIFKDQLFSNLSLLFNSSVIGNIHNNEGIAIQLAPFGVGIFLITNTKY